MGFPRPLSRIPDDDPDHQVRPIATSSARKKAGFAVRTWMAVDSSGQAQLLEAGKHAIMNRTGLPPRDLRILDPLLSYPSTILGRDHAIVINLEHIKAIITANEVLLLNAKDPAVEPFVNELQRRLLLHHHRNLNQDDGNDGNADWTEGYDKEEPESKMKSSPHDFGEDQDVDEKVEGGEKSGLVSSNGPKVLPFEFIALESCLEAACSCLENEATTLEKEAHPALDKLTTKISTLNLERVRQIKSRLVAITGRVQKVRDELEHLLDDDDDMAEMYLTDKLMQQNLTDESPNSSPNEQLDGLDGERYLTCLSIVAGQFMFSFSSYVNNFNNNGHLPSGFSMINEDGHLVHTCSTRSGSKHLDVQDLEMLLEAYFVQVDSTLNKLSTLREYVDDTEDYINIMLDDKQNHLLQMGVMLTTATLIVSAYVVLAGIFGMNIQNKLFDEKKSGTPEFLWTVGGGAAGSLLLYVVAVAWCKHRRLLE
ncbi:magnesium transporter MRS2-3 isoform X2 [Dioscorea cayenensis subsp. rotundata]|uniref:Magnesium transporter n=1 Tax=Dioscorea cayennensis subsp. rotundata TaxID=55577 RepID=A0AB40BU74_DIOCR|nr:magnesium transporter MRS2-3 isoform X2 [Dioscorea cayenensis subsp. rotundata]